MYSKLGKYLSLFAIIMVRFYNYLNIIDILIGLIRNIFAQYSFFLGVRFGQRPQVAQPLDSCLCAQMSQSSRKNHIFHSTAYFWVFGNNKKNSNYFRLKILDNGKCLFACSLVELSHTHVKIYLYRRTACKNDFYNSFIIGLLMFAGTSKKKVFEF
ncbi:hypothetical protein ACJX0J_005671 [Zea mays]